MCRTRGLVLTDVPLHPLLCLQCLKADGYTAGAGSTFVTQTVHQQVTKPAGPHQETGLGQNTGEPCGKGAGGTQGSVRLPVPMDAGQNPWGAVGFWVPGPRERHNLQQTRKEGWKQTPTSTSSSCWALLAKPTQKPERRHCIVHGDQAPGPRPLGPDPWVPDLPGAAVAPIPGSSGQCVHLHRLSLCPGP